jgi:hypothetical protein
MSWSEADPNARQRFVSAVGVRNLLDACPPNERETLITQHANAGSGNSKHGEELNDLGEALSPDDRQDGKPDLAYAQFIDRWLKLTRDQQHKFMRCYGRAFFEPEGSGAGMTDSKKGAATPGDDGLDEAMRSQVDEPAGQAGEASMQDRGLSHFEVKRGSWEFTDEALRELPPRGVFSRAWCARMFNAGGEGMCGLMHLIQPKGTRAAREPANKNGGNAAAGHRRKRQNLARNAEPM